MLNSKINLNIWFSAALCAVAGYGSFYAFHDPRYAFLIWFMPALWLAAIEGKTTSRKLLLTLIFIFMFVATVVGGLSHYSIILFLGTLVYGAIFVFTLLATIIYSEKLIKDGLLRVLFLALVWTSMEFISNAFLFAHGRCLFAYSQYANTNIIQIASLAGPYGLSFFIFFVNLLLVEFFRLLIKGAGFTGRPAFYLGLSALVVVSLNLGGSVLRKSVDMRNSGFRIAVVQSNVPEAFEFETEKRFENLAVHTNIINEALKDSPDLVVWPESSVPGFFIDSQEIKQKAVELAKEHGVPFLIGMDTAEDKDGVRTYYDSMVLIDKEGSIADKYYKIKLIPFAEYAPIGFLNPERPNTPEGYVEFGAGSDFKLFSINEKRYATPICSEIIFPEFVRKFVLKGADFLINPTNEEWAMESDVARHQMAMAVFRAVENRVSVVRAANSAFSCVIDPAGNINNLILEEDGSMLGVRGYFTGEVWFSQKRPFYSKNGNLFAWICVLISILGGAFFAFTFPGRKA